MPGRNSEQQHSKTELCKASCWDAHAAGKANCVYVSARSFTHLLKRKANRDYAAAYLCFFLLLLFLAFCAYSRFVTGKHVSFSICVFLLLIILLSIMSSSSPPLPIFFFCSFNHRAFFVVVSLLEWKQKVCVHKKRNWTCSSWRSWQKQDTVFFFFSLAFSRFYVRL